MQIKRNLAIYSILAAALLMNSGLTTTMAAADDNFSSQTAILSSQSIKNLMGRLCEKISANYQRITDHVINYCTQVMHTIETNPDIQEKDVEQVYRNDEQEQAKGLWLPSFYFECESELKKKDDLLNMIAICNQYIGTKLKGPYSDYATYKKCLDKAVNLLEDPLWRELRKTMGLSADSLNHPDVSAIIQNWTDLVNQRLNILDKTSKFEYEGDPVKPNENLDKLQEINVILERLKTKFHNTANAL